MCVCVCVCVCLCVCFYLCLIYVCVCAFVFVCNDYYVWFRMCGTVCYLRACILTFLCTNSPCPAAVPLHSKVSQAI